MEETKPQPSDSEPSLRQRNYQYVRDHWIVFLLFIAGAIASIYFGFWPTERHRELTYSIQPVRTAIIQTNRISDLSVTYKGRPINGNLSAGQVMISNVGKELIDHNDILSSIVLVVSNATIIECSTNVPAKDGTEFTWSTNYGFSRITLDWKILERGDNPVIQVLYAGEREAPITLEGRVKGQDSPKRVAWSGTFYGKSKLVLAAALMAFVAVLIILATGRPKNKKELAFYTLCSAAGSGLGMWLALRIVSML